MPAVAASTLANRVRRLSITIPAAGSPANLEVLVVAAMNVIERGRGDAERPHLMGGKIWKPTTAYTAGDSTTSQPLTVLTTETYTEPSADFLKATYVASSAGAFSATISVYLNGDGLYMNLGP